MPQRDISGYSSPCLRKEISVQLPGKFSVRIIYEPLWYSNYLKKNLVDLTILLTKQKMGSASSRLNQNNQSKIHLFGDSDCSSNLTDGEELLFPTSKYRCLIFRKSKKQPTKTQDVRTRINRRPPNPKHNYVRLQRSDSPETPRPLMYLYDGSIRKPYNNTQVSPETPRPLSYLYDGSARRAFQRNAQREESESWDSITITPDVSTNLYDGLKSSPSSSQQLNGGNQVPYPYMSNKKQLLERENYDRKRKSKIPKFGQWDEDYHSAAVSYTQIFTKMSEERQKRFAGQYPILSFS